MNILRSLGIKRQITAALETLMGVLIVIPGTSEIMNVIRALAAFLGITGLGHAAVEQTLSKKKVAGVTALLAILIQIAHFIPELEPFIPFLQKIAALLGSVSIGIVVGDKGAEVPRKD